MIKKHDHDKAIYREIHPEGREPTEQKDTSYS
jgi:hypothetical protein